jgi:hypothetical protein
LARQNRDPEETSALSLPDPLLRYVLEAKPHQEALRNALIQLSGFLLKRTIDCSGGRVDYLPVEFARQRLNEAADGLHSLRAPPAAAHHRLHLDGAAAALEQGLACAFSTADRDGDGLFHFLEEAMRHLRAVSRATPGLELVDLGHACCAMHGAAARFEARPAI